MRKGHMDYDAFCRVAEMLYHYDSDGVVTLTGGEPTMHPDFKEIVLRASQRFDRVCVTTNGSFGDDIARYLVPLMDKNVYLQISIDGTQEVHDAIRGNFAFECAVHNIKQMYDVSSHIAISTTVRKGLLHQIKELAIYFNNLSFHHWKVSQEQLQYPSKTNIILSDEWNAFVDELLPLCHFRVMVKKMFAFDIWNRYLKQRFHEDLLNCNCGLGRNKVYITPEMDVMPCTCMDDNYGNLLRDTWEDIAIKLKSLGYVVPAKQSVCYTCMYKIICNGGCPGYSKKVFGVLNMGDIRCPYIKG